MYLVSVVVPPFSPSPTCFCGEKISEEKGYVKSKDGPKVDCPCPSLCYLQMIDTNYRGKNIEESVIYSSFHQVVFLTFSSLFALVYLLKNPPYF